MGNYGIKISQDGYNVRTATPDKLILSSAFATMPVYLSGTANQSISIYSSHSFNIAHGLSYTPYAIAFYKSSAYSSNWVWIPDSGAESFLGSYTSVGIRVDSTNLTINALVANTNPETITIKYYIFAVSL
jgi:hypothetical protein